MVAGMSIDMFVDPDADPRDDPPTRADERATLAGFLRWQRDTLELKCSGLDAADLARRSVDPSTLSLLGLVRHMAEVERSWFRRVMAGQDAPPHFYSDADPDGDFDGPRPTRRWSPRPGTPGGPRSPSPSGSWPTPRTWRSPASIGTAARCRCAGCWCT
jgi:Protein of unknown function (DUF664)